MKKLCLLLLLLTGMTMFINGCRRPAPNAANPTTDPNQAGPIYLDTATPTAVPTAAADRRRADPAACC